MSMFDDPLERLIGLNVSDIHMYHTRDGRVQWVSFPEGENWGSVGLPHDDFRMLHSGALACQSNYELTNFTTVDVPAIDVPHLSPLTKADAEREIRFFYNRVSILPPSFRPKDF